MIGETAINESESIDCGGGLEQTERVWGHRHFLDSSILHNNVEMMLFWRLLEPYEREECETIFGIVENAKIPYPLEYWSDFGLVGMNLFDDLFTYWAAK